MYPHLVSYLDAINKKKVKSPGTGSYVKVKNFVMSPLVCAKLAFFKLVFKQVERFLVKYQTDAPMMP